MVDLAFKNAAFRKDVIVQRLAQIRDETKALEKELQELDAFIHMWHKLARSHEESDSPEVVGEPWPGKNPSRDEVGRIVREILVEISRPVALHDLYSELQKRGLNIRGKRPPAVLNTMMWRMQDQFVKLPEHGFWLRDVPYTPDMLKE